MSGQKPHIFIEGFSEREDFRSRNRGRSQEIPEQDRHQHGLSLSVQYEEALSQFQYQQEHQEHPIAEEIGIYLEIVGVPGIQLPLDSLDTVQTFKLQNLKRLDNREIALVFIPESKRNDLKNKIEQFLDPNKGKIKVEILGVSDPNIVKEIYNLLNATDWLTNIRVNQRKNIISAFMPEIKLDDFKEQFGHFSEDYAEQIEGINFSTKPRNNKLISSIDEINIANLRSFWTDGGQLFPEDENQTVWWELWLKIQPDEEPLNIPTQLAERIDAQLGNTSITFFDSVVVLIKASPNQLSHAPELISNLKELRRAKETPNVILNSSLKEQQQWIDELNDRIELNEDSSTTVTILDAGVNYNHPLISHFCDDASAERWNPVWPK